MRSTPAMRWSAIAATALAVAAVVGPASSGLRVPIYDGIGNPDEPYRYVDPPAGYRATKPPAAATATLKVSNGQSASAQVNTDEYGPQLALFVPAGALAPPDGAAAVTVTAAPVAATDPLPSDGTIVGNVYRLTASAPGGTVDLIGFGNNAPVLDMRAPTARQPGPVFEHLGDGRWTASETVRVGNDVYRTRADALGEWALVQRSSVGDSSRSVTLPVIAGVLGVSGLGLAVLAIRRSRTVGPSRDVSR